MTERAMQIDPGDIIEWFLPVGKYPGIVICTKHDRRSMRATTTTSGEYSYNVQHAATINHAV